MKTSPKMSRRSSKSRVDNKRSCKATEGPAILYKAFVKDLASPQTCITSDPIIERIDKCLQRAKHRTTPELEAKVAFNQASRLMQQHNIAQLEYLTKSPSAAQQECAGHSVVSLRRADGSRKRVVCQKFAEIIATAINKFFACKSFVTRTPASTEWTFYGVAENTVAAAMAFEVAYNLTCEWARSIAGIARRNSYCLGVGIGRVCMANEGMQAQDRDVQPAESQIRVHSGWGDLAETAYDAHRAKSDGMCESEGRPAQRYNLRSHCQRGLQADIKHDDVRNVLQPQWQAFTQLVAFRRSAGTIADEYLQQSSVRLSRSQLKPVRIKDVLTYTQGGYDSRKIDVRRGGLQRES